VLAVTCNGPGETAGWLRPLLRALYAREPGAEIAVFFVPDDYATGTEPAFIKERFPATYVYTPKEYLRVALGGSGAQSAGTVLYLGGDLMHAARLRARLGGRFATYKFSRRRYARTTAIAFALGESNAQELRKCGVPPERVAIVGNLAIDGALEESACAPERGSPQDGILIMPGSRGYEVEQLVPFFFTAALAVRREDAAIPIAFGISPFTRLEDVRRAAEAGGDPRVFAVRATVIEEDGGAFLATPDGRVRFPIVRSALASAKLARLVVTIPGTKVTELAVLGKPVVACSPYNALELVTINGPLTYLNRVPVVGTAIKRAAVLHYARRMPYHTQPNLDAGAPLVCELRGTLTPGRVARVALERASDAQWLDRTSEALSGLYRGQAGAAARMAQLLQNAG
jgi:hypothetical protein